MTFLVVNPLTGERFKFEDEALANAKAAEIRADVMVREDYRFTVAKEVVNGNNTIWINADLDNDPEDGTYNVFNTFTGLHEKIVSLSAAIARRDEIKVQFADSLNIVPVIETPLLVQPISQGAQTL
jgi:hypothetical protein